jgi:hypothetical protein
MRAFKRCEMWTDTAGNLRDIATAAAAIWQTDGEAVQRAGRRLGDEQVKLAAVVVAASRRARHRSLWSS